MLYDFIGSKRRTLVHDDDQKYLKFSYQRRIYQFIALPNGLTSGPRDFTKLLKFPLAHLRGHGHAIIGYIDDKLILTQSEADCRRAVQDAMKMLTELGLSYTHRNRFQSVRRKLVF